MSAEYLRTAGDSRPRELDACMQEGMYVCMYERMYTCMHTYIDTHVRTYIHAYIHTCHTCIHAYVHMSHVLYMCACVFKAMDTHVHAYDLRLDWISGSGPGIFRVSSFNSNMRVSANRGP